MRVRLISDTHNLIRPEAFEFLRGCDHIIHAGDIGAPDVLDTLACLASITAVRGNNDHGEWTSSIRETDLFQLDDVFV